MLSQGSVPHCAPVACPVRVLVRQDGEHAGARLVLVAAQVEGALQQLAGSLPVPFDLGRRGAPGAGAGQVQWFALDGHGAGGEYPGCRGLEQDGQTDALGVQRLPSARLFNHAVEVAVVPVVGGVDNLEIILTQRWKPLNSEMTIDQLYYSLWSQSGCCYERVFNVINWMDSRY